MSIRKIVLITAGLLQVSYGAEKPQLRAPESLAERYMAEGRYDEAQPILQRALSHTEELLRTGPPRHSRRACKSLCCNLK